VDFSCVFNAFWGANRKTFIISDAIEESECAFQPVVDGFFETEEEGDEVEVGAIGAVAVGLSPFAAGVAFQDAGESLFQRGAECKEFGGSTNVLELGRRRWLVLGCEAGDISVDQFGIDVDIDGHREWVARPKTMAQAGAGTVGLTLGGCGSAGFCSVGARCGGTGRCGWTFVEHTRLHCALGKVGWPRAGVPDWFGIKDIRAEDFVGSGVNRVGRGTKP
jgi:hypothetical protein